MTSSQVPTSDDLARVERLVGALRSRKRSKIETLPGVAEELTKKWLPNPGPQTDAYHSPADELFYGGEAGGGKSDLLEGLALNEHENSLLLRRTNKEASKFIKRFSEIVGDRKGWNGQRATFTLPGRAIEFGGCQLEDDKQKYKGDPHDLCGFDEIADFTESQYRFIIGWNRSARKGQRCRVVAAGNPPTRPEGLWVLKYWGAWLDPTHRNPAKPGELRWYTTIGGEDREVDGPGPHLVGGRRSWRARGPSSRPNSATTRISPRPATPRCWRRCRRSCAPPMVPAVCGVGRRVMASVSTVVIYSPPKAGLPYLVVTIANGEIVDTVPVASRDAARAMIAQKNTYKHHHAAEAIRH